MSDKKDDVRLVNVHFVLKSGVVLVADKVDDRINIERIDGVIVRITNFKQVEPQCALLIQALNLSQIDAVFITKVV